MMELTTGQKIAGGAATTLILILALLALQGGSGITKTLSYTSPTEAELLYNGVPVAHLELLNSVEQKDGTLHFTDCGLFDCRVHIAVTPYINYTKTPAAYSTGKAKLKNSQLVEVDTVNVTTLVYELVNKTVSIDEVTDIVKNKTKKTNVTELVLTPTHYELTPMKVKKPKPDDNLAADITYELEFYFTRDSPMDASDLIVNFDGVEISAWAWWDANMADRVNVTIDTGLATVVYNTTFKLVLNSTYANLSKNNCSDIVVTDIAGNVMQYGFYLCHQNETVWGGDSNTTEILVYNSTWAAGNTSLYVYMNSTSEYSTSAKNLSAVNNVTLRFQDSEDGTFYAQTVPAQWTIVTYNMIGNKAMYRTGASAAALVFNFSGTTCNNITTEFFLMHNTSASCGFNVMLYDTAFANAIARFDHSAINDGADCPWLGWGYYTGAAWVAYSPPPVLGYNRMQKFTWRHTNAVVNQSRLIQNYTVYGTNVSPTSGLNPGTLSFGTDRSGISFTYYVDQLASYCGLGDRNYTVYYSESEAYSAGGAANFTQATLISPANGSNLTSVPVNLTFVCNGTYAAFNASVFVNGTFIINVSALNNTNTNYTYTPSSPGVYNWSVNCSNSSLTNSSATWTFSYQPDVTVTQISPANNTNLTAGTFSWNCTDGYLSYGANISIDGIVAASDINTLNNTVTSTDIAITGGAHNWSVKCFNSTTNNESGNWTFTYLRPVTVGLISPANASSVSQYPLNLTWTCNDSLSSFLANVSINSVLNASDIVTVNGTTTNYSLYASPGTYNWSVSCGNGTVYNTSENRTFYYQPLVGASLYSPANDSVQYTFTSSSVGLSFFCNGSYASYYANLSINGTVNASNIVAVNGTEVNQTVNLSFGVYNWTVKCWNGSTINTTDTWLFNYTKTPPIASLHSNVTRISDVYFNPKYVRHLINNSCRAHVEPAESASLLYVKFTLVFRNGTTLVQDGIQNLSNPIEFYTSNFSMDLTTYQNANYPGLNEYSFVNCSVTAKDDKYTTTTRSINVSVGYSLNTSCNTSDDCNMTGGITSARGNYYYDYIELPSAQTMTIVSGATAYYGAASFYAKKIVIAGAISKAAATGGGPSVLFNAYNITTASMTLDGEIGTACNSNGRPGAVITYANFSDVYLTGTMELAGGGGYNCTTLLTDGSDGGASGQLILGDGVVCGGIVHSNATINILSGGGGRGGNDTDPAGDFAGAGGDTGTANNAITIDCVHFKHDVGVITIGKGIAGAGGNSTSGGSGAGGYGQAGYVIARNGAAFSNNATFNVVSNRGGDGGNGTNSTGGSTPVGGEGGDAEGFEFQFGSFSFLNISQPIYVNFSRAGNGGDTPYIDGAGGNAYGFNGSNCGELIPVAGTVCITNFVNYTKPAASTGNPGGSAPTDGPGWTYSYNNTCAENNFTRFGPARTNNSFINAFGYPSTLSMNATDGYTGKENMTANFSQQINLSGIHVYVTPVGYTYPIYEWTINNSNFTQSMHRWINGTYTLTAFGYHNGLRTSEISNNSLNVSWIPTNLSCASNPANLTNMSSKAFTLSCNFTNTLDNYPVYYAGLRVTTDSNAWYLHQTGNNASLPYTGSNPYYYPSGYNFTQNITAFRTDYVQRNVSPGNISFQKIIIEFPPGVSAVKSICLFPTHYNVNPVGQNVKYGIFRIVNLNNASAINITTAINATMPDNITQWLTSSYPNYPAIIIFNTSAQRVLTNLSIFDNTQNVSNYSSYLWLYTNCTGVNISTGFANYTRAYVWDEG